MLKKYNLLLLFLFLILLNFFNIETVKADKNKTDITGLGDFNIEMTFDETDESGNKTTKNIPNLSVSGIDNNLNEQKAIDSILIKYRGAIYGFLGVSNLTIVLLFITNIIKLGKVANNPPERSRILNTLFWVFIGGVCIGGLDLYLTFFTNLFK